MNGGLKKDRIPSMYKYNQTIEVKNIVRGILLHYYLTFSHIFSATCIVTTSYNNNLIKSNNFLNLTVMK